MQFTVIVNHAGVDYSFDIEAESYVLAEIEALLAAMQHLEVTSEYLTVGKIYEV